MKYKTVVLVLIVIISLVIAVFVTKNIVSYFYQKETAKWQDYYAEKYANETAKQQEYYTKKYQNISYPTYPPQAGQTTEKKEFSKVPELVTFSIASDVSKDDEQLIREGIAVMDFYLQSWFGRSINQPVIVDVSTSGKNNLAEDGGKFLLEISTKDKFWLQMKSIGMEVRPKLVAHEYVHIYQENSGCGLVGRDVTLRWLMEGMAEWLSYKAMQESGNMPSFQLEQILLSRAEHKQGILKQHERESDVIVSLYATFALATDYLMKNKPIKALDDFCTNRGKGMAMPKAFEAAFGIPLNDFYDEFDTYLANT